MDISDLLEFVRKVPFFSIYSNEDLRELIKVVQLKPVNAGELIFEQGSAGDCFYIVYSGKVRIFQKNEHQKEINLGVRTKGDNFGETALITENPRNASARAVEDSVLLSLSKEAFQDYLLSKPELREYFDKFIRFTSIHRFLKSCTGLSAVPSNVLRELITKFNFEFFKEGEAVFRQGAKPDKLYLIESGSVQIVRSENKKSDIINFLREGDFFGEKALFEDTTRFADVVCLTDCRFFSLSRDSFNEFIAKSPELRKIIEDRIQSYLSKKPPIPYNEIIKQELAGLKDVRIKKDKSGEAAPPTGKKRFRKLSAYYYQGISFPFIRQHDEMSCGVTCIMMIAKYYGKSISSGRLRELAGVDMSGSSLADLASAAEQIGFSARGMRLDYNALKTADLPCIVHWQGYHYIIVHKIDEKRVSIADPAIGLRTYDKDFFVKNWSGFAIMLQPTPEFEEQSEDASSIRNFAQFLMPYKLVLLEIFAASLMLNIFGIATPIFTQKIVDKVLPHQNVSMLNVMLVGMLLILVFRLLTAVVRQYLIVHTSMKIDLRMLVHFYKHLLALPLGYFKARRIGDFITRFSENLKIRNFMINTALTLVLDSFLIIIYLSLMFYYSVEMAGVAIVFIPLFVAMTLLFTPALKRLNVDSFAARVESESHLVESINAIETIKAMNIEHATRWKWENKFIKTLNIDFKLYSTATYFHSLGDFAGALGSTVILWYGAHKVMEGTLSIGELMAFTALMGSVITPINRIIYAWDGIQQTLVSVDRLNDVFTAKTELPERAEDATGIVLREPRGEIVFDKVFFRFKKDSPYILSNISFKADPGQKIAIVGRSGSGKSTLVKLIARLYEATEGKIFIDGMEVQNLDLSSLRKQIGFVIQDNFIFNGSIFENISLGDAEATRDQVVEAARMAEAHEFISNIPTGYETKVGESGLQLSGGQKQRIAIARALYCGPKILILDEATSALDTESEQAIQRNMKTILKDKTAFIIAHRLSTVKNADRILVLDNGEIVEAGTHEELMTRDGLYRYLNFQQLNV